MEIDDPTRSIVEFTRSADYDALSDNCVHAIVRNYVDTISCSAIGFNEPVAVQTRQLVSATVGMPAASALGIHDPIAAPFAILANASTIFLGEFHDDELTRPPRSRISPALVAIAEANSLSTRDLICAIYVGYQVVMALGDDAPLRDRGFGQALYLSIGIAAATGKLLGLTDDELANAISIAAAPGVPLRVANEGPLSNWGSLASAYTAMNAVLAAQLARAGLKGPERIFDGKGLLFDTVTGPFSFTNIAKAHNGLTVPQRIAHRSYPSFRQSQGPIRMMIELRNEVAFDSIEAITLEVTDRALRASEKGQASSDSSGVPATAESAYFSFSYLLAAALLDGKVTADTLAPERINDPALHSLMQKITVGINADYSDPVKTPRGEPASLEIRTKNGQTLRREETFPRGDARNPLSDQELSNKFDLAVSEVLPNNVAELRDRLWNLPNEPNLMAISTLLRQFVSREPSQH